MPKARDPARDKARELWESSGKDLKLREIAEQLNVPETSIRAWKSLDDWDNKKINVKKNVKKKDVSVKKKRGGQPGHPYQGGAPPAGSINAVTTGAFMRIYGDLFTEEEKLKAIEIYDQTAYRIESLRRHLSVLKIREARLLQDIYDIRFGKKDMLTRRSISQMEPTGKTAEDGKEIVKVIKISQEQEARRELLQRFEDALTRLQAEIRRTEDSLRQTERAEIENEKMKAVNSAIIAANNRQTGGGK